MTEPTPPPAAEPLTLDDHQLIHLHHDCYQWIDVHTFTMAPGVADDPAALEALIAHVRYRHCYAPTFIPPGVSHGQ